MIGIFKCSILTIMIALSGCSWFESKSNYGDVPYRHKVKYRGESIGILAEWYTGDITNWQKVVAINKNIDPEKIEIGDIILIPKELIIRKESLTEEFCALKNKPAAIDKDPVDREFENKFRSPLQSKQRKETEELIKNREDLWNELIGE